MIKRLTVGSLILIIVVSSTSHSTGHAHKVTTPQDPFTLASAATLLVQAATPVVSEIVNKINFTGGLARKSTIEKVLQEEKDSNVSKLQSALTPVKAASEEVNIVRQFARPSLRANEQVVVLLALIPHTPNETNVNEALWARLKVEWDIAQGALEELKKINVDSIVANVSAVELTVTFRRIQDLSEDERIRITTLIAAKDITRIPELKQLLQTTRTAVRDIALINDTELRRLKTGIDGMAAAMEKAVAANKPVPD